MLSLLNEYNKNINESEKKVVCKCLVPFINSGIYKYNY